MITHATVQVSGDPAALEPFRARLAVLLAAEGIADAVSEHHGDALLHYDLKVAGGLPFPPFVAASQEFPPLTLTVEWVSDDGATRGSAVIREGRLVSHDVDRAAAAAATFVSVDRGGALELALRLLRAGEGEWRGYAVTADRDALFRIARDERAGRVELVATAGPAPAWRKRWVVDLEAESFEDSELSPPEPIAEGDVAELTALADAFASEWLWFASAPAEDIAVERQRYERLGYPVRAANVRAAKLAAMERRKDGSFHACLLDEADHWVKEVLEQCWANS